jgi:hypothetical protein
LIVIRRNRELLNVWSFGAIVHWIEKTYHRRRRKRSLGKMTPVEYEVAAEAVDKEYLLRETTYT